MPEYYNGLEIEDGNGYGEVVILPPKPERRTLNYHPIRDSFIGMILAILFFLLVK